MTCSKFDYSIQFSYGSILCCNWHQKLIFQGQHLTHSCELYQKKTNLNSIKNNIFKEDRRFSFNDRSELLTEFFNGGIIQTVEEKNT